LIDNQAELAHRVVPRDVVANCENGSVVLSALEMVAIRTALKADGKTLGR
jgi:hypothetical protein